jgi:alcohol dehydrogenase class IV
MRKFAVKPEIFFSDGAVKALADTAAKRIFVIIDPVIKEMGFGSLIEAVFKDRGDVRFMYYDNVEPDPPLTLVSGGVERAREFLPDMVVSVGGGSAIDESKAIVYIYNHAMSERDPNFKKPIFAVIPTTSGTGSEVTKATVLTDGDRKLIAFDEGFLPDIAIMDIDFAKSMPLPLLAETGFDALTHAFETIVSKFASDFTDAVAEKAAQLVFKNLEDVFSGRDSLEARTRLHNAACLAGIGFTNASLGINHSMAHAIGAVFHIPHGRANAILLTKTLEFNAKSPDVEKKLSVLCAEMELDLGYSGRPSSALIGKINTLLELCEMPASVKDTGLTPEAYAVKIPDLAGRAMEDGCTAGNPITPTYEDIIELLIKAY